MLLEVAAIPERMAQVLINGSVDAKADSETGKSEHGLGKWHLHLTLQDTPCLCELRGIPAA